MSHYPPSKPLPSHLRNPTATLHNPPTHRQTSNTSTTSTASGGTNSAPAPPALSARIAAKQRELADLRELRDLSAQVADQLAALRDKLGTLSDGTQAVALVLANWHSVLQAISMASGKIPGAGEAGAEDNVKDGGRPLPETLVRIPVTGEGAGAGAANAGDGDGERNSVG